MIGFDLLERCSGRISRNRWKFLLKSITEIPKLHLQYSSTLKYILFYSSVLELVIRQILTRNAAFFYFQNPTSGSKVSIFGISSKNARKSTRRCARFTCIDCTQCIDCIDCGDCRDWHKPLF